MANIPAPEVARIAHEINRAYCQALGDERLDAKLTLRLKVSEKDAVARHAKREGVKPSAWVRSVVLPSLTTETGGAPGG